MFQNCAVYDKAMAFDDATNKWDVSKVTTMKNMFNGAKAFNQALSTWVASSVLICLVCLKTQRHSTKI